MKRFLRSRLVLALVTLVILVSAIVIPLSNNIIHSHAASSSSQASWNIVPSQNIGTNYNYLFGVAAVSSNDVWAVGYYVDANGNEQTLIEQWNGISWSIISSPSPGSHFNRLNGVTAISANDVWAVGSYVAISNGSDQTLVEHWNGSTWSIVSSPNPGGTSCFNSSGCNILTSVAAVSSNDVWAVGSTEDSNGNTQTLIEQWDGTNWSVVPSPNPGSNGNSLSSVAAVSASDIWAVGNYFDSNWNAQTLIEQWDGTNWGVVPSPSPSPNTSSLNYLQGVTAVAANDVWAVGFYRNSSGYEQTLIEQWDGTNWSVVPSPNSGTNTTTNELVKVATDSSSDLWAVGFYVNNVNNSQQTLIEQWNGTSWSIIPSPNSGTSDNDLFGVAAVSSSDVWAVGYYQNTSNIGQTLLEHYLPSTTPTPSGAWITPSNGFSVQAGTTLQLSANAYPALADSSIQHVGFAANWNGSWQTICTTTSSSNTFGCNWNLTDTNRSPIPNGALQVEFTIYDSSGTSMLSPVLQGTITPPQVQQQMSGNWAGYVVTGKQYTDVKGSWVQPAISCRKKEDSDVGFWVGLDGFSSKTVEQIGTSAICKNGKAIYFVWYEMYPDKPVVIFTGLQPNDHAQAEVSYQGNDKFKLSITLTDGVNTWTNPLTVLKRKGAARNSAEWIAEAPCQNVIFSICTSSPWPQFGTVTFSSCSAGGISIASGPTVTESTMTYGLFKSVKGQPSSLDSNNTGFSVQWEHA